MDKMIFVQYNFLGLADTSSGSKESKLTFLEPSPFSSSGKLNTSESESESESDLHYGWRTANEFVLVPSPTRANDQIQFVLF